MTGRLGGRSNVARQAGRVREVRQLIVTIPSLPPVTVDYSGACVDLTVPPGAVWVIFDLQGAEGSASAGIGGKGGRIQGTILVTSGEVLRVCVGQHSGSVNAGFNGGAKGGTSNTLSHGGGGGGATSISRSPYTLADRLVVAGGGGGGGASGLGNPAGTGGAAGGLTGSDGTDGSLGTGSAFGYGGTQSAGGAGGAGANPGLPGTFGVGGNGHNLGFGPCGGGGGGGWYGGGGAASFGNTGSGGGGGSSYLGSALYASTTADYRTGHGVAILAWGP